jgi:hypothetical protein
VLFLRRRWSDRARYTVLIFSWSLLLLDMCVDNFIVADPVVKGPYYGIAGYWCWIAPAYSTERYTSEYLFMFLSSAFSFVLYSLVFLRTRGNITISAGNRVRFHHRPKVGVGRTSAEAYIAPDNRRVESHLTAVAKQMLWYPVAYTFLVLPVGATRFSATHGASVPFPITVVTAAVLMLSGFVNVVLFCMTRSVIPGRWRQRLSINATSYSRRHSVTSSWGNSSWPSSTRKGTGRSSFVLDINVEKAVEIRYDEQPIPASDRFGLRSSPTSPACPLRTYDGRQRADTYGSHIQHASFPPRRENRKSDCLEEEDNVLNERVQQAHRPDTPEGGKSQRLVHTSRIREKGMSQSTIGLEAPASVYPFSTAPLVDPDARPPRSLSWGSADFAGNAIGIYWAGHDGQPTQHLHTSIDHLSTDEYTHIVSYFGTQSRLPAGY